jgi:hypothetical protein
MSKNMARLFLIFIGVGFLLSACNRDATPIPTRIPSIEALATSEHLTAIAPPVGIHEGVSLPRIDDNLVLLPNWRSEASFRFEGVFSGTPRTIDAQTDIRTWYNQVGNRRRVVLAGSGELFGDADFPIREAVRLGGETYLILDDVCYGAAEGDAALLADLRMGDVLGGVRFAPVGGEQRVLHGQTVWRYDVTLDQIDVPLLRLAENSAITSVQGELWVARVEPNQNVAIRYYVNLQVENVVLRLFDSSLPVTGTLQLRYDVYDIGINPNITPPNGC